MGAREEQGMGATLGFQHSMRKRIYKGETGHFQN